MNKHFQRDLDHLRGLLKEQLERIRTNARTVLLMGGEGSELIPDTVLDQEEVVLEEECLKISAIHQPVADDLRYLTAVLKSNRDLERIGDLLENLLDTKVKSSTLQQLLNNTSLDVVSIFGQAETVVSDACRCLEEVDPEIAKRIWAENKGITDACGSVIKELRNLIKQHEGSDKLVDAMMAMHHLVRISDHAANIAKNILYVDTGEIVRHRRKEILGESS